MNIRQFLDPVILVGTLVSVVLSLALFAANVEAIPSITFGLLGIVISLLIDLTARLSYQEARLLDILGFGRSLFKESDFQILLDTIGFASEEEVIRHFRKKWHHYHVTLMDGEYVWRHGIYDFGQFHVKGRLAAEAVYTDARGNKTPYRVEAGMRDQRLVCLIKTTVGKEPTFVEIQPLMGLSFQPRFYGIAVLQTWDGTFALTPTIMSLQPVHECDIDEDIRGEMAERFDKTWLDGFSSMHEILPRINLMNVSSATFSSNENNVHNSITA